ncbi:MAG: hypothetical protein FJX47_04865 [Alphaproteobacteria bacterium]|nr:hypothetical protein [Alphaproteobacteria bacterium]
MDALEAGAARYRERDLRRYFRADAAFANPEVYAFLEAEGYSYTIRLPANRILRERIGYLRRRPVGRPALTVRCSYAGFSYQAQSWTMPRRVVAKVVRHARYAVFQMAEVAVPRDLFEKIPRLFDGLRRRPAPG